MTLLNRKVSLLKTTLVFVTVVLATAASALEFEFVLEEVCLQNTAIDGLDCSYENEYVITVSDVDGVCTYDYSSWVSTFLTEAVDDSRGICMLPESTGYLFCMNTGSGSDLALCDSLGEVVWIPGNPAGSRGQGMSWDNFGFIWEIEVNPVPDTGGTLHKMKLEGNSLITVNSWDLTMGSPYGVTAQGGELCTTVFVTDLHGDYIYYFEVTDSELELIDEMPVPLVSSPEDTSLDISYSLTTGFFYWITCYDSTEMLVRMSLECVGSLEQNTWAGVKSSFLE